MISFLFISACFAYFIIALVKSRLAVLLLLGLNALWPSYVAIIPQGESFAINPKRVGLLLLFLAWLMQLVINRPMRVRFRETIAANRVIFYAAILYFLFGIVTSIFSSDQVSKSIAAGVLSFASYPLMLIFVISFFSERKHFLQLFFTVLLVAVLSELVGIIEWTNQGNLFALFVDPVSDIAKEMIAGKIRGDVYRIQSTFSNPLSFAEFLLFIMPIGLYFVNAKKYGKGIKLLAATQITLGLLCIYLTSSRMSSVLAVLIIIVYLIWKNLGIDRSISFLVGAGSLILVTSIFISMGYWDTYIIGQGQAGSSAFGRRYQLVTGIPAILRSPFWGYGLNQGVRYVAPLTSIDNYYLTVALETGLLGLVMLLLYQGLLLKLALRSDINTTFPSIGFFLALAFFGVFINELTLSIIEPFSFLFAIAGVLMVKQKNENVTSIIEKRYG